MKNLVILFTALFLMTFAFQSVNAQVITANDDGNASAQILADIAITADQALEFGAIGNVAGGGSVVIPTSGAAQLTDVTHPVATNVGQQGTFNVLGAANATYTITLSASAVLTNQGAAGGTMNISSFLCDPRNNPGVNALSGVLSAAGTETLNIGATLTVAAAQNPGLYTGTYNVQVDYN